MKMFEKTESNSNESIYIAWGKRKIVHLYITSYVFILMVNIFPEILKELENIEKFKVGIIK